MLTYDSLQAYPKEALPDLIPTLDSTDIDQLVAWLVEKEDNFRYKCFLLLEGRSRQYADVYPHWDILVDKLGSANSYQRSIGLMLIAENARWDDAGRFEQILDRYLSYCDDEKPVTVRQCIQGLTKIVPVKPNCLSRIADRLFSIDLMQRKETQRKILLLDILSVLIQINRLQHDGRIDHYVQNALTGGILDNKSKRLVESL